MPSRAGGSSSARPSSPTPAACWKSSTARGTCSTSSTPRPRARTSPARPWKWSPWPLTTRRRGPRPSDRGGGCGPALWTAAGLLGAAAAGFLIVSQLIPDPNAQLLQDLPILENYDQYRVRIGNIEFLRALSAEKQFADDADASPAASPQTAETLSQRRQRVEAMPAEQRDNLLESEEQFRLLSSQDQQQMRELHDQIEIAPSGRNCWQPWTATASGWKERRSFLAV